MSDFGGDIDPIIQKWTIVADEAAKKRMYEWVERTAREGAKRAYVNRSNLVPLLSTDEVAQPMAQGTTAERLRRLRDPSGALSPEDFIKAIKHARTSERLRSQTP